MSRLQIQILIPLLIAWSSHATAQSIPDTAKSKVPLHTVSFSPDNFDFGNKASTDSVSYILDSFQIVHPFLISTGNLGAPGKLLYGNEFQSEPFSVRPDAFSYFGFNRNSRRFYFTNKPYTEINYFVGQRREQYVDVLHTGNFGENLNLSFHFKRIRSEGFYRRQNTSNTSLRSNLWYKAPAKRNAFLADVYWTGANVAENGGLANDSTFEFSNQIDRQINEVNLDNAGTVQRKRGAWTKHTFAFGKVTDTLELDSAHVYNVITPAWGISLISELSDEKYNYTDGFPLGGFYNVTYRDTLQTNDSTYCWRINNSVRLEKFNQYGKKSIRGFAGVRHEAGEYFNDTIYRHFNNVYAEGQVTWSPDSVGEFSVGGNYVVNGTNKGNYALHLRVLAPFRFMRKSLTGTKVMLELKSAARSADMIFTNYSGNHLRWQNSFSVIDETTWNAGVIYTGTSWLQSLGVTSGNVTYTGYLYFDSTFLPQQYNKDLIVAHGQFWISTKFAWFNTSLRYRFNTFQNDTLLRMPEHVCLASVYADLHVFKKAMRLQVGADITWFSEFTAEAYMPNVAQFYLQNSRTVGNYTYISPWVSFRIKPVRVFVKVDHANAGLMGRKYFMLDNYPANDMAVKIGVSWLFSD